MVKKNEADKVEPDIEIVEDEDDEEIEDDEEEYDQGLELNEPDLLKMFQYYFTNDDGENIVDVMSSIKKSIDTQNKILMKLLQKLDQ